jgi:hypothetical protein
MPFKNSYKFDVISKGKVKVPEAMPKFFLSDNKEEAEKIYEDFKDLINILAYNYARYSGLDKADIFGEALIGLGRAYRDWDKRKRHVQKLRTLHDERCNTRIYERPRCCS